MQGKDTRSSKISQSISITKFCAYALCLLFSLLIYREGELVREEFPALSHATSENFTTTKTPFSRKEAVLAFSFALRGLVFRTAS